MIMAVIVGWIHHSLIGYQGRVVAMSVGVHGYAIAAASTVNALQDTLEVDQPIPSLDIPGGNGSNNDLVGFADCLDRRPTGSKTLDILLD